MDLRVILGPPGAGKAARAVRALVEAAEQGHDAFLCVPGAVDRARFLRELGGSTEGAAGAGVLIGVEVGTFDQLVARIAGSPPVRRTDRAMERLVVRDALRDLPTFAAAARWSGFVETARGHVDQLRRARVWGGVELARVEGELPGGGLEAWHELEARVGAILRERRLRDDAWFERRAVHALRAGEPGVDAVVVYGFEALPPARVELLERLARTVPVTVALGWRPGRRVHERAADLRDRWRDKGAFIETVEGGGATHPVLDWLADELFEDTDAVAPVVADTAGGPAPVAFVDCCGPLQEAEEVVREVARLAGNGFAWDDIVVASVDAGRNAELLAAAFARASVPVRVQARRTAVDVPAGRSVHELLDAVVSDDPLRVVAALRAPVFALDPRLVDEAEVAVRGSRYASRSPWSLPRLRAALPEAVVALRATARGRGGPSTIEAVRALLANLLPADPGELDLLRGIAAMLEGLVVAAGGEDGVALADVRDAVCAFPLAVPDRSDTGSVVVASIEDLRSIAFDAVVLHGMHAGGFRARVDDESDAPAAGRDLLYLAVTRARRTLRVVRQAAGSDGGHLAPSPAWQELRRLAPAAPVRTRRLGAVVVDPADVVLASERAAAVALAEGGGAGRDVDGVAAEVRAVIGEQQRHAREPQLVGAVWERLASTTQLAVTAVERYAVCSAKWFIETQLRAQDPDEDRSRLVEGSVAHALLQRLVPSAWETPHDDVALRERARELVPELVAELDPRGVLDAPRIDRIVEHVMALVEAEAGWARPDAIEVERSFGGDAEDSFGPGYDVDGVEVVGRIDRIDRHGSRVVLHDYKYGSTDRPARELLESRNLQLLVYWLAMERPGSPLEPVGAVYRAITKGGAPSGVLSPELRELGIVGPRVRSGVLDEDARRELLDGAASIVASSVAGIRAGIVAPLDDPERCPSHCRLQHVCRIGEGRRP